jgi:hypothetical protein
MRKVAIIGRCDSTRADAPLGDPEWETWGLAWDAGFVGDRYFEIHARDVWTPDTLSTGVDYTKWLRELDGEKILAEAYADIPGSRAYPLDAVMKLPGLERGYLESSIAYMLAMARLEDVPIVGIWGVDLTALDEYAYQRPNLAYLMGLFRYQGMQIRVPRASALWELSLLDGLPAPDFDAPTADRFHLEYLLGRETARGAKPAKLRSDLMTSIWSDPPRYGFAAMDKANFKAEAA